MYDKGKKTTIVFSFLKSHYMNLILLCFLNDNPAPMDDALCFGCSMNYDKHVCRCTRFRSDRSDSGRIVLCSGK